MFDDKTAPDVKAKLNHYAELYKDNIFMKNIIKKKEKLIKKQKQQQKNKKHANALFFINQLVEKIDLLRNIQFQNKKIENATNNISKLHGVAHNRDLNLQLKVD